MKIKITNGANDIIIDYIKEKNRDELRLKMLEFITRENANNSYLYVNTNSKYKEISMEEIETALNLSNLKFQMIPCQKEGRKRILGDIFKAKDKNKDLSESLIFAKINDSSKLNKLYDKFLKNYDFAILLSKSMEYEELYEIFKKERSDMLFNKDIFSNTLYDSITYNRIRMDSPYDVISGLLEELKKKS